MAEQLLLLRHGHVAGIDPPRFRGREDIPLSALGLAQAAATASYLGGRYRIRAIFVSPLSRCVVTGRMVSDRCQGSVRLDVMQDLLDIDYGSWQGRAHAEVQAEQPGAYEAWCSTPDTARIPKGETLRSVARRAAQVLQSAEDLVSRGCTLLVSHNSTIRVILLQALGLPLSRYWLIRSDPCGISVLERRSDGSWGIGCINGTAHLSHLCQAAPRSTASKLGTSS